MHVNEIFYCLCLSNLSCKLVIKSVILCVGFVVISSSDKHCPVLAAVGSFTITKPDFDFEFKIDF